MATEDAYGGILAIPTQSTNELVYKRLKEAIVTGSLPPGHRIIEERIVARLGVSRAPLREAIRLLAHEGLIQRTPRRGAYVAVLFKEDAIELYQFRMALEGWAVEQCCGRISPSDLRDLRHLISFMHTASSDASVNLLTDEDTAFHERLCQLSGNQRLLAAWRGIAQQIQLLSACSTGQLHSKLHRIPTRHEAIVDAIASGDRSIARQTLIEHVRSASDRIIHLLPDQVDSGDRER